MTARADVSAGIEHTIWRIDPARSSVEFHVKHFWGLTTVKGCFSAYHGRLDLSARSAVELTIEAARPTDPLLQKRMDAAGTPYPMISIGIGTVRSYCEPLSMPASP